MNPITSATSSTPVPRWRRRLTLLIVLLMKTVPIILGAAAFAVVIRLLVLRSPIQGTWTMQVMLALAALLACCWSAIRRHHDWNVPLQQMREMLPHIRAGTLPIEELSRIRGPIVPLAFDLRWLFQDLREKDKRLAELNDEMRQRVASRTEALERSIGSLKTQAARDSLTGLNNRRSLDDLLPTFMDRAQETRQNLCVLMIDVDNFKLLNDTRGHAAGDELLKTNAQLIRSGIRDPDVAFRVGGDEFVVLLPDCEPKGAKNLADRLTSLVDAMSPTLKVNPPPRLSIGVSSLFEALDPTPSGLLEEADQALYSIKSKRDRVRRAS